MDQPGPMDRDRQAAMVRLARDVAHDLNNQATGIVGFAELLAGELPDPRQRRFAGEILLAGQRVEELAKRLREAARAIEGWSVLVVDDEPGLCRALALALEGLGCRARACVSAREAEALVPGTCFDLVLVDLNMPELDGLALARSLRERCPDLRIAFMTGGLETEADLAAAGWRGCAVLHKPFGREELQALLAGCV